MLTSLCASSAFQCISPALPSYYACGALLHELDAHDVQDQASE